MGISTTKFNQSKKTKTRGFSFIEILIFITILNLFFILALSITVFALRNLKENEHKLVATHYLGQLKEWISYQKDLNGMSFSQISGAYCYNSENLSATIGACPSDCAGSCLGGFYNRQATFTPEGNTSVVEVKISWKEVVKNVTITEKLVYSTWEK